MTQESLHPGPGGGALREALAKHEFEQYYLRCGCSCGWGTTLAESKSHWALWAKHFADVLALSLSSPIEPPRITVGNVTGVLFNAGVSLTSPVAHRVTDEFNAIIAAQPTPQASSEIREALDVGKLAVRLAFYIWEISPVGSIGRVELASYIRKEIESALAPSRQGAGGK